MGSKVMVTETFAGRGIQTDGWPSKTILFYSEANTSLSCYWPCTFSKLLTTYSTASVTLSPTMAPKCRASQTWLTHTHTHRHTHAHSQLSYKCVQYGKHAHNMMLF